MYTVLRACLRAALHLYCGRIRVDARSAPPADAVLLLAGNHPNSFLDALLIATHLPHRMRFLARGDAFRKPWAARLLRALYMIPIHRMSEGRAELKRTAQSFHRAHDALARGCSVLVFSEGLSVNENGLRPLGKGTARIAYRAWQGGLDINVLPVWLHYDTFRRPFMEARITSGEVLARETAIAEPEAIFLRRFNAALRGRLLAASGTPDGIRAGMDRRARKVLLLLPALLGLVLHAPWYFPLRAFTAWRTRGTVFFDSVLFGLLFLSYPAWLLALLGLGLLSGLKCWALLVLAAAPMTLLALRKW